MVVKHARKAPPSPPPIIEFLKDTVFLRGIKGLLIIVALTEKHKGSLLEGFTQTQISTLAVKDELMVAGGFQGELICKMPYLDEWSALEEDYSASLQALVEGLLNVSSQLPLIGNIKADAKEIEEVLNRSLNEIEMIFSQVQGFMPKAEQVGYLISDLASVCSGEIAHVKECGDLLSKTYFSFQVKNGL